MDSGGRRSATTQPAPRIESEAGASIAARFRTAQRADNRRRLVSLGMLPLRQADIALYRPARRSYPAPRAQVMVNAASEMTLYMYARDTAPPTRPRYVEARSVELGLGCSIRSEIAKTMGWNAWRRGCSARRSWRPPFAPSLAAADRFHAGTRLHPTFPALAGYGSRIRDGTAPKLHRSTDPQPTPSRACGAYTSRPPRAGFTHPGGACSHVDTWEVPGVGYIHLGMCRVDLFFIHRPFFWLHLSAHCSAHFTPSHTQASTMAPVATPTTSSKAHLSSVDIMSMEGEYSA